MPVLYLIDQNTVLRKTSDRLVLTSKPPGSRTTSKSYSQADVLLELPCNDVDHVMLFGNIQVTTQALQELLEHGIELALFTFSGKLLGQLTPAASKNITLRIAQFEKHRDEKFVLNTAKAIVLNKIGNALAMLRQHRWNHPEIFTDAELAALEDLSKRADNADNLDSLRGHEGSATAAYFKLFGRMFKAPWKFSTRTRRPPKDPVNAVLSFGYVVVGSELQSLLDGAGFDPYLGFYHAVDYGRPSLALDILEEFRHTPVDRLALNLFNLGIMEKTDFMNTPGDGVYMNTSGKKKFFEQYEKMLGEHAGHMDRSTVEPSDDLIDDQSGPQPGKRTFRVVFQRQITALTKAVAEGKDYAPFNLKLRSEK